MEFLKRYVAHLIVVLIVAAMSLMLFTNRWTATRTQPPEQEAVIGLPAPERSQEVGLAPVGGAGFEGTASLVQREGRTTLELSFRGPGNGTEAVVLQGTCDDPGELLYPLTPVVNDSSHTELVMRIEDMTMGEETVAIALREEGSGALLSCGTLDPEE